MDEALRPDLSRILPKPWLRQLARGLPLAARPPAIGAAPDFLVDVQRRDEHGPDDAGFGIGQARTVAERIAAKLRREPRDVHRVDAARAQLLLAPDR